MIYLDEASTSKPKKEVVEAIMPYLETFWHNPSTLYSLGKKVHKDVDKVRKIILKKINANKNDKLYFTSGATESNNWAMRGFYDYFNLSEKVVFITTPIEHNSITKLINSTALSNAEIHFCKVHPNSGIIDFDSLEKILKVCVNKKIFVSISIANNEIGTIQDVKSLSRLIHKYNGIFHTDATQAFGHIPIDVKEMGIDIMSCSAQKIGGLKGTGFLYVKNNICLNPLIYGSQENGMRGGTENVVGIIALGKAVELIDYKQSKFISDLRDYLINCLSKLDCSINGSLDNRLPNNVNVTLNYNITGEALVYMLDTCGIYISSGSACNVLLHKPSQVLKSIGLSNEQIDRTVRITLPDDITREQIDKFIFEIQKQIKILEI